MAVYVQHIKKKVPPILDYRSNLPRRIQRVVERALAKEPDRRYQSAAELAKELSDAAGIRSERTAPSVPKLKAPDLVPIGERWGPPGSRSPRAWRMPAPGRAGRSQRRAAAVSGGKAVAAGAASTGKAERRAP